MDVDEPVLSPLPRREIIPTPVENGKRRILCYIS
jgi:hypothetical protein